MDKFGRREPYKPAILVNVIWFLIMFFIIRFLNILITGYLHSIGADINLILVVGYINATTILIINLVTIALLINFFYKNGLKDSIFIALAIISIQVFLRIIIANVLSIIFNITTGGYLILYQFQFI